MIHKAYRKMNVTRERIRHILELREILLSFQTGFSLVNAAVDCTILESISGLEPTSVITEPRFLKLATVVSWKVVKVSSTLWTSAAWVRRVFTAEVLLHLVNTKHHTQDWAFCCSVRQLRFFAMVR